jgi:hypothetical protein
MSCGFRSKRELAYTYSVCRLAAETDLLLLLLPLLCQVQESHLQGQLDEERKKVTAQREVSHHSQAVKQLASCTSTCSDTVAVVSDALLAQRCAELCLACVCNLYLLLPLQEIATLSNDLVKERNEHDRTREELAQAKTAAARPSSAARTPAPAAGSGGAGATPTAAAAAGAGGRRKRQRTAVEDEDAAMAGMPGLTLDL